MPQLSKLTLTEVQELRAESNAFQAHANELKKITDQMFTVVDEASNVWAGQDREVYTTKFDGLQDSTNQIYQMIIGYHDRLERIADGYETMVEENKTIANGLKPSIDFQ